MPTISMFYGILIQMYWQSKGSGSLNSNSCKMATSNSWDATHANDQHVLRNSGCELLEGDLPSRQMKLVQAWIELHQDDLMADWHLASTGQTPFKIEPLR